MRKRLYHPKECPDCPFCHLPLPGLRKYIRYGGLCGAPTLVKSNEGYTAGKITVRLLGPGNTDRPCRNLREYDKYVAKLLREQAEQEQERRAAY